MNWTPWARIARRFWKPVAGVAGLAAILAFSSGGCTPKERPGRADRAPGFARPANAATVRAERRARPARVEVIGTVVSETTIRLSARLPAYVESVRVSAGDAVTKGQTLLQLDARDLREQLAVAEAQGQQAEKEYARTRKLFESQAATEQALTAAQAAVQAARAQIKNAQVQVGYATLTAPVDGVVIERTVEAGDLAAPGQVLLSLYDPRAMRLEAPVPVRLMDRVKLGQTFAVRLDGAERDGAGRVTEIVSEVDAVSRTQRVKLHLEGVAGGVLPGAFGRMAIETGAREQIAVPASAVYAAGQLELVQVVEGDRVLRRLVKTGPARDGEVEILSGLNGGEDLLAAPVKER